MGIFVGHIGRFAGRPQYLSSHLGSGPIPMALDPMARGARVN